MGYGLSTDEDQPEPMEKPPPTPPEEGGGPVRAFVLNFGDDERNDNNATGIISVHDSGFMVNGSDAWYTLDGRKLSDKPTQRGIYVNNGRKVVIK